MNLLLNNLQDMNMTGINKQQSQNYMLFSYYRQIYNGVELSILKGINPPLHFEQLCNRTKDKQTITVRCKRRNRTKQEKKGLQKSQKQTKKFK